MNEFEQIQSSWNHLQKAYQADLPAVTAARARKFLATCPDWGPAWKILGSALIDLARHSEAEAALKQALALCPPEKLWIPLAELGHLERARGNYEAAAAWYRRAIDAVPNEAGPHIFLGGILARSGRLKEAEAAHRAATKCTQGCRDEAWLNLGFVLRAQERYQEAAECFNQALALDSKYLPARRALRDVRQLLRELAAPTNPTPPNRQKPPKRQHRCPNTAATT
jgi:tetratricopeptide (TPR) repeat protein